MAPHSEVTKVLWRQFERLIIRNGILLRVFESTDGRGQHAQLVLPRSMRKEFLREVHAGIGGGHLGRTRMEAAVRSRAYWPGWSKDVRRALKICEECARYVRSKPPKRVEMEPVASGEPWETIALGITGPHPTSSAGHQYILTCQDLFSKWVEAFPIRRHTASVIARLVFEQVILRFGAPRRILTDQAAEFQGELFGELLRLMGIDRVRSSPYRPQTNGCLERFHRTLNSMLAKVISENQRDWHLHLPAVLAAYRASVHETTGYTPNRVILGRENLLPVDLVYGRPPDRGTTLLSIDDFVADVSARTQDDFARVRRFIGRTARRRKKRYDIKVAKEPLWVGQKVWYYYPRKYKKKSPKWQSWYTGPFTIERFIDSHVVVIRKNGRSKPQAVHRDKLKPVSVDGEDGAKSTGAKDERPFLAREEAENLTNAEDSEDGSVGVQRETRRRRRPLYLDDYQCRRVDYDLIDQMSVAGPMETRNDRFSCMLCRSTFQSPSHLQRHCRTAVHRARERGEATPPRSRQGLATRLSWQRAGDRSRSPPNDVYVRAVRPALQSSAAPVSVAPESAETSSAVNSVERCTDPPAPLRDPSRWEPPAPPIVRPQTGRVQARGRAPLVASTSPGVDPAALASTWLRSTALTAEEMASLFNSGRPTDAARRIVAALRDHASATRERAAALYRERVPVELAVGSRGDDGTSPEPDSTETDEDDGSQAGSQRSVSVQINRSWTSTTDEDLPNPCDPLLTASAGFDAISADEGPSQIREEEASPSVVSQSSASFLGSVEPLQMSCDDDPIREDSA